MLDILSSYLVAGKGHCVTAKCTNLFPVLLQAIKSNKFTEHKDQAYEDLFVYTVYQIKN